MLPFFVLLISLCYTFLMIVSNNTLLNILIPHENKALTEVLKEADIKTMLSSNKGVNVADILKNLFDSVQNQSKSNEAVSSLLKNSTIFKEFGSFPNTLQTLLTSLPNESKYDNFKSMIQNFLLNIDKLDDKSLKEQILKSGIFLESKLNLQSNPNSKIENILLQIKDILQNINTPVSNNISTLIDKTISNNIQNNSLNQIVSMLKSFSADLLPQNLSKLSSLITKLQDIGLKGELIESKMQNSAISQSISKSEIVDLTKSILNSLKAEILNSNNPNSAIIAKQVDTLLLNNDLFSKNNSLIEPKNLLANILNNQALLNASSTNINLSSTINNLQTILGDIKTFETNLLGSKELVNSNQILVNNLQESLLTLKQNLNNLNPIEFKPLNNLIDKLLGLNNLFFKVEIPSNLQTMINPLLNQNSFNSNFANSINSLISGLKSSILDNPTNLNQQNSLLQNLGKLEGLMASNLNQNLKVDSFFNSDIKASLLNIQADISSQNLNNDSLKHIDKLLTQIDYYQLLSITNNSNYVYLPFIWDILEDGSISIKKSKEEKFYCEINLKLKEFGDINMMLSLYDKNHLDITIYASNEKFKNLVHENLQQLRLKINEIGLVPINISIVNKKEQEETKEQVKVNQYNQTDSNLGFGVDIKA